jgi:SPP1 family predicted phage head-tail adaptor
MSAGELRDRVTFFRPTTVTDALRGQAVTYTSEVCTVAAQWRGLTTRETLIAQGQETLPAARLVLRYRDDITTRLRAQRNGSGPLYEVASVNDFDGRRIWLDVDLVEVP